MNFVPEMIPSQPIQARTRGAGQAPIPVDLSIPKDTFVSAPAPVEDAGPIGSQSTEIAHTGSLLTPEQLKAAMKKEKNFNFGTAPDALKRALGQSDAEIHASLNHLGASLYKSQLARGESREIALKKGGSATVAYLDHGFTSVVYKLSVGGQNYVMKVFRPGTAGTDIAYRDVANGAFLNAHEVADASRLYMANPEKNWTLMEHIGPEANLTDRPGKTLAELGFESSDDGGKNRINGILVDHGSTLKLPAEYHADEGLFREALQQISAPSLLKRLLK